MIYIVDYFKCPKTYIHVCIHIFLCICVSECTTYAPTQVTLVCWCTDSAAYQEPTDTVFCCLDLSSSDGCIAAQVSRQFRIASEGKEALAGYLTQFEPGIKILVNRLW